MREKIHIVEAVIESGNLVLIPNQEVEIAHLLPKEQVIVDSDNVSFIYLAENVESYTYIFLPEAIWASLKRAMEERLPVMLKSGDKKLELPSIYEELTYLIDNIEGNGNYGEEFVAKVEQMFIPV
ncbi:UPF0738 family protein [Peribacillus sp. JNUCC 23]